MVARTSIAALLLVAALASAEIEVGFCESDGSGFRFDQPADQLERWDLPQDNGTHLVIQWWPDASVSGRNVSTYWVDAQTSMPVLNFFIGNFGSFPQDICAPGCSQAANQVQVEGSAEVGCNPYSAHAHQTKRLTSFEIPYALRLLAGRDITVTVRAYGSHAPIGRPDEAVPVTWWCHKYRRKRHAAPELAAREAAESTSDKSGGGLSSLWRGMWRAEH